MNRTIGSATSTSPGISIEGDRHRQYVKGDRFPVRFEARFPDSGNTDDNVNWIKSLFLTCVSRKNAAVDCVHFLRSAVVLPDDYTKIRLGDHQFIQYSSEFDCAEKLKRGLIKDSYYLHISARYYTSSIIRIDVT